jgi:NADH:ubiquinone oxidoreductase subunit C
VYETLGDSAMIKAEVQTTHGAILYLDTATIKNLYFYLQQVSILKFTMLLDGWATHFLDKGNLFQVNYFLANIRTNSRIFLRYSITPNNLGLLYTETLTSTFPAANWFEREMWDLFGIVFLKHPDLRRILTDYGFEGFPLRKDFPVCGYFELKYNALKNSLIYVPVKLNQEFRYFIFENPWN